MIKKRFLLILFLLYVTPCASFAEQLTETTLRNDIRYYERTAREKSLTANDRYYILLQIEKKYLASRVDLTLLKKEMQKLHAAPVLSDTVSAQEKTASQENAVSAPSGTVDDIQVSDTEQFVQVMVLAPGVTRTNYFLLKDPDPKKPSTIVLDLYDARDKLSEENKKISFKAGYISLILAGQFESEPEQVVRVTAQLRTERPYKIEHEGDQWIIRLKKSKEDQEVQSAAALPSEQPLDKKPVPRPVPAAAAKKTNTDTYRIEPGDVLGVAIYPAEELSRQVIVQADGLIAFPLIGTAQAKGSTTQELEKSLTKELGKYISNPKVTVSIQKFSRRQIFITGQVRSVGAFDYKDDQRLMEFISSRGGFAADADRQHIKIFRGPVTDRKTIIVNVESIIQTGDFSKDFVLEPGDIIEVPKAARKVSILGEVGEPGYVDVTENIHLTDIISSAGGYKDTAKIKKITLLRAEEKSDRKKVYTINLKNILTGKEGDPIILPGDTIYVPQRSISKANWFISNVMPWLSLAAIILALRGGV